MDVKQMHLGNNKSMINSSSIKRLIHFVHSLEEKLSSVKTINEKLHELISVVSKTHDNIVEELTTIKTVLNEVSIEQKQDDDEIIPIDATKSEWDDDDDDDDDGDDEEENADHNNNNNNNNHTNTNGDYDTNHNPSYHVNHINPNEQTQRSMSTKEFESKSVTNLSTKDQQNNSPASRRTDRLSLYSASSFGSSSTSSTIENRPSSSTSKRSSNLKKNDQSSTRVKSPKSVTFSFDDNKESNMSVNQSQQSYLEPIDAPLTELDETTMQMTTSMASNSNEIFRLNSDLMPELFKQHHNEVTNQPNIGFKMGNALTSVRIHEIESMNGDYLRLLNISNSDDYDLSGHFIQQNIACVPVCRFRFPQNTIIRAGQTITIWCGTFKDIEPQFPHIFVWKEKKRWETSSECVTILAKPNGQAIAWARSSYRLNGDQSSSDILFVHSKTNVGTVDEGNALNNTLKSRSRLSASYFIGSNKPPFAQSPDSPAHPYHNGGVTNVQNEPRLQLNHKGGISQLLNRPKSSPFASHTGCKQDLISMKFLRNQQTAPRHKQTSVKT